MMKAPIIRNEDGFTYRDLNKNGRLDPYEDPRLPVDVRVEDLLRQMTLEEKAGLMFHTMLGFSPDGSQIEGMIAHGFINHFNVVIINGAHQWAEQVNRYQEVAESTRLGIPITFSTDPRHAFSQNPLTSLTAGPFSQWPEPIGLAATRDPDLVEEFADIARQEYLAAGIRVALHPMADLATEPRWARINGTFGEDAQLAAKMVAAYIRGFQGRAPGPQSVACMTKHFPGGGPQKDGEDPHFPYGKEQVYPGNNFDYHLIPFEAAFAAGTSQIMPYYGMPVGTELEEVGFGFNKQVITGLLRDKYGFDGIVCTDWFLLTTSMIMGEALEAKAWGVEQLSVPDRARKALEAGIDQFGGEACPEVVVDLVKSEHVSEARIDRSARRILREKFRLGLFDNPYVDPGAAEEIIGNKRFRAAGEIAQRKSVVLLVNRVVHGKNILPMQDGLKIYVENIAVENAQAYGQVVRSPVEADVAILRLQAPYEHRKGMMQSMFHAGDLSFGEAEKQRILGIMQEVPTIVVIYLDRPAVIPEIAADCAALLADFGAHDRAVLDILFGRFAPCGKLPFEMPSSMEAVRKQKSDVPYDSENPLFPFGYGLSY